MNIQFDFHTFNVISIFFSFISWGFILYWAYHVYRNQNIKPKIWKVLIVIFIGIFSFSFNFPIGNTTAKLALLPLGVWILYGILHRKNEPDRWPKYRRFAWVGFFANYLFLLTTIITPFLHGLLYDEKDFSTYITHTESASLLAIHDSAPKATLNLEGFKDKSNNMKLDIVRSIEWYNETSGAFTDEVKDERFPFALLGTEPKWGSGLSSYIFIERDGKGILISTPKEQLYFRSDKPILTFDEGEN